MFFSLLKVNMYVNVRPAYVRIHNFFQFITLLGIVKAAVGRLATGSE